jgi:hypothetical protein
VKTRLSDALWLALFAFVLVAFANGAFAQTTCVPDPLTPGIVRCYSGPTVTTCVTQFGVTKCY